MRSELMTRFQSGKAIALSALCAFGLVFLAQHPAIAEYEEGPIRANGCYKIGDERVKFASQIVETADNDSLQRIASSISRDCDVTDAWDDKWYSWVLPDNRPKYLLLTWKNISNGEYGYALIRNTPNYWYVKTNSRGYQAIHNDSMEKYSWVSNGYTIHIDIKNPKNVNGWTSNHIWYSFGY